MCIYIYIYIYIYRRPIQVRAPAPPAPAAKRQVVRASASASVSAAARCGALRCAASLHIASPRLAPRRLFFCEDLLCCLRCFLNPAFVIYKRITSTCTHVLPDQAVHLTGRGMQHFRILTMKAEETTGLRWFFISFIVTPCGPVIDFTGAHGFVI